MRYNLVVFDWEGTLADSVGQIFQTITLKAKEQGLGEVDLLDVLPYAHLGLNKVIQRMYPNSTLSQSEKLLESVQNTLLLKPVEIFLIPGAKEFIEKLIENDVLMAVASNKGQQSLQKVIQDAGLEQKFAITRSAGQCLPKPNPQMLEEIMDFCGVNPLETLMIGDSVMDMEMAVQLGVDAFGIDFYQNAGSTLLAAGAKEVFNNYESMSAFLKLGK